MPMSCGFGIGILAIISSGLLVCAVRWKSGELRGQDTGKAGQAREARGVQLVIYGNGSMAGVFHSHVRHCWKVAGFTVDAFCNATEFCGRPLVPFSQVERVFDPAVPSPAAAASARMASSG
ncbi:hypothetical protein [Siccirubricoccus phaeus]|uniref:hypothetical protein n=1 Tax=Siccirubricoccus phaeus TaxID=2595053 RepID=UPI0011F1BB48|nr:hypothetical protein [Siccirubricoccus phaeus]